MTRTIRCSSSNRISSARACGGRQGRARGARHVEDEPLARFDPVPGLVYQPVALAQMPFAHQGLQARARQLRQPAGQEQVEPQPVVLATRRQARSAHCRRPPLAEMSDSLLKALKLFVVVGGVGHRRRHSYADLGAGQARRRTRRPHRRSQPPSLPGTIEVPPGGEIAQLAIAGSQLVLLGQAPGEGQFVLVVDLATGARRQLLRIVPAPP